MSPPLRRLAPCSAVHLHHCVNCASPDRGAVDGCAARRARTEILELCRCGLFGRHRSHRLGHCASRPATRVGRRRADGLDASGVAPRLRAGGMGTVSEAVTGVSVSCGRSAAAVKAVRRKGAVLRFLGEAARLGVHVRRPKAPCAGSPDATQSGPASSSPAPVVAVVPQAENGEKFTNASERGSQFEYHAVLANRRGFRVDRSAIRSRETAPPGDRCALSTTGGKCSSSSPAGSAAARCRRCGSI